VNKIIYNNDLNNIWYKLQIKCVNIPWGQMVAPITYITNHAISWNLNNILTRDQQPIFFASRSWIPTVVRTPLLHDKPYPSQRFQIGSDSPIYSTFLSESSLKAYYVALKLLFREKKEWNLEYIP
jgi:hypothetical protein